MVATVDEELLEDVVTWALEVDLVAHLVDDQTPCCRVDGEIVGLWEAQWAAQWATQWVAQLVGAEEILWEVEVLCPLVDEVIVEVYFQQDVATPDGQVWAAVGGGR